MLPEQIDRDAATKSCTEKFGEVQMLLPTAFAPDVMQSPPSVRPFVSTLTFEPSDLDLLSVYGS